MMINLTLATTAARTPLLVNGNQTPVDVLNENNVSTEGATISFNMRPLVGDEVNRTFEELGCVDGDKAMLSAVVKADSAY